MNAKSRLIAVVLGMLLALTLAGCGGGGGGGGTAAEAAGMLTGVAANGAPVVGTVLLKDSSPRPVELSTTTASDGSFAFNTTGLTPPFMLKTTAAAGNLYSLAEANGINNLTPLTTMAVALAAGGADLDALYANHLQTAINAAALKMPDAVTTVQTALAPLLSQFGVTTNLLTGQFSANHTGVDALLDAITISISGATVTITNKQNNAVIFTAPFSNFAAGSIAGGNMPGASPTAAGTALYTSKCAGCHGASASSNLKGLASVAAIQLSLIHI